MSASLLIGSSGEAPWAEGGHLTCTLGFNADVVWLLLGCTVQVNRSNDDLASAVAREGRAGRRGAVVFVFLSKEDGGGKSGEGKSLAGITTHVNLFVIVRRGERIVKGRE